jgi:hypothetical protein
MQHSAILQSRMDQRIRIESKGERLNRILRLIYKSTTENGNGREKLIKTKLTNDLQQQSGTVI